jgi:hypothetical protein
MDKKEDMSVTDMLSAMFGRIGDIATEKAKGANQAISREMRIATLSQERRKLMYALGEKVYERIKGESDEPYIRRLEQIDQDIEALKNGPVK